jgi:hypothetical protein
MVRGHLSRLRIRRRGRSLGVADWDHLAQSGFDSSSKNLAPTLHAHSNTEISTTKAIEAVSNPTASCWYRVPYATQNRINAAPTRANEPEIADLYFFSERRTVACLSSPSDGWSVARELASSSIPFTTCSSERDRQNYAAGCLLISNMGSLVQKSTHHR